MTQQLFCKKLQRLADPLPRPPLPGKIGQMVFEQISLEGWQLWQKQQTMLINEYRLSALDSKARDFLRDEMQKFLFGEGSEKPPGYVAEKTKTDTDE